MSRRALKVIAREKKEKTGKLDLGKCGLSNIPVEIFELTWLTVLNLSDSYWNWEDEKIQYSINDGGKPNNILITELPKEFVNLKNLKSFFFMRNHDVERSNLNCNVLHSLKEMEVLNISHVTGLDISFLSGFESLKSLELDRCSLRSYEPISKLTSLRNLALFQNELSSISFIRGLNNLEQLELSGNHANDFHILQGFEQLKLLFLTDCNLSNISFLEPLSKLEAIYMGSNRINDISSLEHLNGLKELHLNNNNISDLTPLVQLVKSGLKIQADRTNREGIHLSGNPLTKPPVEIYQQGNDAVLLYFDFFK